MRKFDTQFRDELRQRVETVESTSGVELVATIVPRARRYWHLYLLCGLVPALLVLTVMMFVPTEFWYVLIYLETVGTLVVGALLPWVIPGLARMLLGQKTLRSELEKTARALFQQAGMVETRERIGVLVVLGWFEREVVVLADRGADELVPPDEWDAMESSFREALRSSDPATAILEALGGQQDLFRTYIPRDVHDINELPDELWLY